MNLLPRKRGCLKREHGTMILSQSTHDTLPDRGSCAGEAVGQVWEEMGRWEGRPREANSEGGCGRVFNRENGRPRFLILALVEAIGGGRSRSVCSFERINNGLLYLRTEQFLSEVRLCFQDLEQPSWKSVSERDVLAGNIITNIG